jgi:release factor glutamine methyltransferase
VSDPHDVLRGAAERLAAAGVESAAVDARLLLAHVCGCEPRDVERRTLSPAELGAYEDLIGRRAARTPLQHLTGRAYFRYLEVLVGPGVFVPRPETEVMVGWAVEQLRSLTGADRSPVAVDLGTGSGAIAKSLATEAPGSRVVAVEVSPEAIAWARRNLADTAVELVEADLAVALPELDGTVDLVVANPPYIPLEAFASVAPEARDHDPTVALFSGLDGLDAIRDLVVTAARLLRPGGRLAFEHAEVQADSAAAVVLRHGGFTEVRDHRDLTGRSRFVTATSLLRAPNGPGGARSSGRMVG